MYVMEELLQFFKKVLQFKFILSKNRVVKIVLLIYNLINKCKI